MYEWVLEKISNTPNLDVQLRASYEVTKSQLEDALRAASSNSLVYNALQTLAKHVDLALQHNGLWADQLLSILADATSRSEEWRPLLGLNTKSTKEKSKVQASGTVEPDCVLEVARRVVDGPWKPELSDRFRSCLRLIANCSADNNTNRSILIGRGGIESLLSLAESEHELDLAVPTLYNLCVDFDEHAVDNQGQPLVLKADIHEPKDVHVATTLGVSEQILGQYKSDATRLPIIHVLLNLHEKSETKYSPYIADLTEIASRLGLYNIDQLASKGRKGAIADDYRDLLDVLITKGARLASTSSESCLHICEALLNVLSSDRTHKALLEMNDGLVGFIKFPYIVVDTDEAEDLKSYQAKFLKLTYQISAMAQFSVIYDLESSMVASCIDILLRSNSVTRQNIEAGVFQPKSSLLACCCVLIANTITTTGRAREASKIKDLIPVLVSIINHDSDSVLLFPTINLMTRMAMCSEGQDTLWSAGVLRFLGPVIGTKDATLEIQRESMALIRLIVKGRPEFITLFKSQNTVSDSNARSLKLLDQVMVLSRKTIDASTKIEIGRLIIEIGRLLVEVARRQNVSPESLENQLSVLIGEENRDILDAVVFLIKETQSSSLASEGWFGLAVFSIWRLGQELVLDAISRHEMIQLLEDIAKSSKGPQYDNLKIILVKIRSSSLENTPVSLKDRLEMIANEMNLE